MRRRSLDDEKKCLLGVMSFFFSVTRIFNMLAIFLEELNDVGVGDGVENGFGLAHKRQYQKMIFLDFLRFQMITEEATSLTETPSTSNPLMPMFRNDLVPTTIAGKMFDS